MPAQMGERRDIHFWLLQVSLGMLPGHGCYEEWQGRIDTHGLALCVERRTRTRVQRAYFVKVAHEGRICASKSALSDFMFRATQLYALGLPWLQVKKSNPGDTLQSDMEGTETKKTGRS